MSIRRIFSELEEMGMQSAEYKQTRNRNRGMIKGRNRSRFEIFYSIIDVARSDIGKTRIMYGAVLSYEQMTEYLAELTELGFIQPIESEGSVMYRATEKGRAFMEQYDRLAMLVANGSDRETYGRYDKIG